jgi:hypothetical protein
MKINLLLVFLFLGCNNLNSSKTSDFESFEGFEKRFFSDSKFQLERIIFPLDNSFWNLDTESFDNEIINKHDWEYSSLNDKKYLKKFEKSKSEVTLNIRIYDTGVSVNYIFQLKDGKWFLTKIIDEST